MEPLLDIRALGKLLGVSKSQIEVLLARGEIPTPIRIGNLRRWSVEQVGCWIERITPPAQAPATINVPTPTRRGRPRRVP